MRLPDPITVPGQPGFVSVTLTNIQPFLQDQMPNTTVLTHTAGEQYWEATISYGDLTRPEYSILEAQINKTIRDGEKLQVWLPHKESYGNGIAPATVTKINEYTVTYPYVSGRLPDQGTIIQFSNHKKVYMLTSVVRNGSLVTLEFFPTFRLPLQVGTTVKFNQILFNMEFLDRSTPLTSQTFNSDGYFASGATLELRETL